MGHEAFWSALSASCTLLTGVLFVVQLVDQWRWRRSCLFVALFAAAAVTGQVLCFLLLDVSAANLAAALLDVAALGLTPLLARWGGGRLLFSMGLAYSFTFSTVFFSHLLSPKFGPLNLAVRLAAAAALALLLRLWFAPCLHSVYRIEIGGWYGLSLIPMLFGLLFFTLIAGVFTMPDLSPAWSLKPANLFPGIPDSALYCVLLVLPPCTYVVLYQFFKSLLRHYAGFRERTVRAAREAALEAHRGTRSRQREQDALFTVQLLGRFREIEGLTRQGDLPAALARSEALEAELAASLGRGPGPRYADDPILDAALGEYEALAREAGIALTIDFAPPQRPQLDPTALAVVLSNALENAVRACRAQPPGRPRVIRLFTSNTPAQFFLQIENSCDGPVVFDPSTGFPVALREGHGYGTRSIAAFVRQHHGVLHYEWAGGTFRLQILI